ncbi:GNAT family N-acetyltransferase [Sphingomonas panacisoli]|uniref:GNAT family N-acetyltransferase n=2 Tax=Sphingomonas panacisoli TaxID=1813879 RepID=A0A5B8LLS2_9SPHN|nr:GNAT family N-acetyltransferase [Sphingomonas panacisoli]
MGELAERQYNSFQLVGRTLEREQFAGFAMNLRQLRGGFPEIAGDGTYLAFITIAEAARGSGLAETVLQEAIAEAGTDPLSLTVRIDNGRARSFYDKHGFEEVAAGGSYAFLRRTAGGTR